MWPKNQRAMREQDAACAVTSDRHLDLMPVAFSRSTRQRQLCNLTDTHAFVALVHRDWLAAGVSQKELKSVGEAPLISSGASGGRLTPRLCANWSKR
jgi:hypothetical protein